MSGFQEPSIELIHTVKACVADASYPFCRWGDRAIQRANERGRAEQN